MKINLDPGNDRAVDDLKYQLRLGHTVHVTLTSNPPPGSDYELYLARGCIERRPEEPSRFPSGEARGSDVQIWCGNLIIEHRRKPRKA